MFGWSPGKVFQFYVGLLVPRADVWAQGLIYGIGYEFHCVLFCLSYIYLYIYSEIYTLICIYGMDACWSKYKSFYEECINDIFYILWNIQNPKINENQLLRKSINFHGTYIILWHRFGTFMNKYSFHYKLCFKDLIFFTTGIEWKLWKNIKTLFKDLWILKALGQQYGQIGRDLNW